MYDVSEAPFWKLQKNVDNQIICWYIITLSGRGQFLFIFVQDHSRSMFAGTFVVYESVMNKNQFVSLVKTKMFSVYSLLWACPSTNLTYFQYHQSTCKDFECFSRFIFFIFAESGVWGFLLAVSMNILPILRWWYENIIKNCDKYIRKERKLTGNFTLS